MARGAGREPPEAGQVGLGGAGLQHLVPTPEGLERPNPLPPEHGGGSHLLVDSTGIKAAGEGEWSTRKHGASRPRAWRKVHLGIDANTMEVRAIEVTGSRVGDGPMLPELLAQIPPEEAIGLVTADGAYDTRPCHAAIAARQASAVIPTRRNGRPWKETTPGAQARNERLACHPPPRLCDLADVERHPSTTSRRGQDALPQAAG